MKKDGIDSVAVAYQTNLRKSNIDFAKEAFQHIQGTTSCYVMIGDFTDFFDNLDHIYLKKQLCDLLSVEKLPDDVYAVYKNVTRFSYVELQDLLMLNGLEDTRNGRKEFNDRSHERALLPERFRQNKNLVHPSPHPKYGVPQGSPISAVFANVYMLAADRKLQEYVSSFNGFYMRYSDDFIVIIPQSDIDFSVHYKAIKNILDSVPHLELKDSKTKVFYFNNTSVKNCTNIFISNGANGKNIIEFLGFSFDGKHIRIRDKTISKYYNRLYRKLRTLIVEPGIGWREDDGRYSLITNYSVLAPESTMPFLVPGDDRYERATQLLNTYGKQFTVADAVSVLRAVRQEGIWATRVSFVYSAKEHAVYYVRNNDFSQIEKYEFPQL